MKVRAWHIGAAGLLGLYLAWKSGRVDLTSFGVMPAFLAPGQPNTVDTSMANFLKMLFTGIFKRQKEVLPDQPVSGSGGGSGGTGSTGTGGGYCATDLNVPFYATWIPGSKQEFLETVYFDQKYNQGGQTYYRGEPLTGSWKGYKVSAKHGVLCELMNQGKVSHQNA